MAIIVFRGTARRVGDTEQFGFIHREYQGRSAALYRAFTEQAFMEPGYLTHYSVL